jgi:hypothetical protein
MKNYLLIWTAFLLVSPQVIHAQTMSTTGNRPAQTSARNGIPSGASVYGVFVGRTPCQELAKDMNETRPGCAKRKLRLRLYQDPVTHKPTLYETHGLGKWTGKGKWHIVQGTPADPLATVFQLELDTETSLFLLKGDDNVLFLLDKNRNFFTGNASFSYTMNRAAN